MRPEQYLRILLLVVILLFVSAGIRAQGYEPYDSSGFSSSAVIEYVQKVIQFLVNLVAKPITNPATGGTYPLGIIIGFWLVLYVIFYALLTKIEPFKVGHIPKILAGVLAFMLTFFSASFGLFDSFLRFAGETGAWVLFFVGVTVALLRIISFTYSEVAGYLDKSADYDTRIATASTKSVAAKKTIFGNQVEGEKDRLAYKRNKAELETEGLIVGGVSRAVGRIMAGVKTIEKDEENLETVMQEIFRILNLLPSLIGVPSSSQKTQPLSGATTTMTAGGTISEENVNRLRDYLSGKLKSACLMLRNENERLEGLKRTEQECKGYLGALQALGSDVTEIKRNLSKQIGAMSSQKQQLVEWAANLIFYYSELLKQLVSITKTSLPKIKGNQTTLLKKLLEFSKDVEGISVDRNLYKLLTELPTKKNKLIQLNRVIEADAEFFKELSGQYIQETLEEGRDSIDKVLTNIREKNITAEVAEKLTQLSYKVYNKIIDAAAVLTRLRI
ncbi:hypothetical protein COT48_03010 [Candidatus Woesearchaeota archaeon CG08_land_8_20_14_0_20_47_9]|nr:MAG: hypothetical protein AUJ69_00800 [Candidatus Woesearchaeota archaeon CG1_02_47_18]PIO03928.1 MAG: hypothetical protein COT48_03010 [Candidatus Woesearchaeota archaeon CG08_land_8_20_14_0_20_47_9]